MFQKQFERLYSSLFWRKVIGSNKKWLYMFVHYINSNNSSRFSSLGYLGASIIRFGTLILIWSISRIIGFNEIFTYFIIGNMFFINLHFSADLLQEISNGEINKRMLYPSNLLLQYLIKDLGWNFFIHMVNLLICIVVILLFKDSFIFNLNQFFIFILFLPIVYFTNFVFEVLLGSVSFFIPWSWGIVDFLSSLYRFLNGSSIPLNLLTFTTLFIYFAPSNSYYHPMQIYLGKYSLLETFYVFAGGIVWCVILYFLAKLVFKLGLKKNEAVGL